VSTPQAASPAPPTPRPRVVIAGVGLTGPLAPAATATFRRLLAGRRITERAAGIAAGTDPVLLAQAVGRTPWVPRGADADDPAVLLAERAAREAAGEAGVDPAGLPCWVAASKGAVEHGGWRMGDGGGARRPGIALGPHGYLAHRVSARTGMAVRRVTVAACASGLVALDQARRALLDRADVAPLPPAGAGGRSAADSPHTAGDAPSPSPSRGEGDPTPSAMILATEAALLPVFVHSYRRLGVLAPLTPGGYAESPLAAERGGFVLSEAAAAVVLRRLEPGEPVPPRAVELVDTATAAEAYDMVRPSPAMAAVRHVAAHLAGHGPVDVLHPHATGTDRHDPAELKAIGGVMSAHDVYACKGALGHALGAAGLVSLVVACLCLRFGRRPPMPWLDPAMDAPLPIDAAGRPCRRDGAHAVFAAGFAGHVAGALVRGAL